MKIRPDGAVLFDADTRTAGHKDGCYEANSRFSQLCEKLLTTKPFYKPSSQATARLTPTLLTWRIWRASTNASKWQMRFNSAFKGLINKQSGSRTSSFNTADNTAFLCTQCSVSSTLLPFGQY